MKTNLVNVSTDKRFFNYVASIPVLSEEEEYFYTKEYYETKSQAAAEKIITANFRYVLHMCHVYRGYKLPLMDMFQEGVIGLIKSLEKFEPHLGNRFLTFASSRVKEYILKYVCDNVSIVRQARSKNDKKLFFNMKSMVKGEHNSVKEEEILDIADKLDIPIHTVRQYANTLYMKDAYLDDFVTQSNDDSDTTLLEIMPAPDQSEQIEKMNQLRVTYESIDSLDSRTKDIIVKRYLEDEVYTLDDLSKEYNISKERVRQIEFSGINKLKDKLQYANV